MSAQQVSTVVFTVVAAGTISPRRAIARDATQAAAGGGAGVAVIGFADHQAVLGEALKVNMGPTAMAEAGAALNGSTRTLKTDAHGRLIATAGGSDVVAAILLPGQTSENVGDIIEVIPVVR